MNYFKRASTILLSTVCAVGPVLATPFDWLPYEPYVGADLQERQMSYKRGYGDNLMKKTAVQGNFYVGTKLQEHMAVEFGYEATKTKSKIATLHNGELSAGCLVSSNVAPAIFRSSATIKGPHFNLVGFHGFAKNPDFKLFASVGLGVFRAGFQRETIQVGTLCGGPNRILSKNKPVIRFAGGTQYMLNKHLGTRLSLGFTNTSNVVARASDGKIFIIKPKDTTFCGLGVLWVF